MKLLLPAIVAFALIAAACGGGDDDGGQAADDASPEGSASVAGSPSAEASASRTVTAASATSSAPSATPTATSEPPTATPTATTAPPTPTPTVPPPTPTQVPTQPPAVAFTVSASNLVFSQSSITVASGAQVTLTFDNQDAGIPHSLSLTIPGAANANCTGPCTTTETFTAPAAGSYGFFCNVHPDMTGAFIVT